MKKTIKAINKNGEEKEYDVILTFNNPKNNKDYIVYTDNSYDEEGKLKVFAALYDENSDEPFIGYPTTNEEWQDIYKILDDILINSQL